MKILIVGSEGQLGRELVRQGRSKGIRLNAPAKDRLDITDVGQVQNIFKEYQPSLVINAAAYTDVDGAESEPELAFAVNKNGTTNLAQCAAVDQVSLIHISTDYVFDGSKQAPYLEEDPIAPIGVYGRSKAEGEATVRSYLKQHVIVRTSWLYGIYGHNFLKTMLKLIKEKKTVRVVADQYGSPTSTSDLAAVLLNISTFVQNNPTRPWGTYHYCGRGITTWHAFAAKILELASTYDTVRTKRIIAVKTGIYPTCAKRPPYSALDCSRIQKYFGIKNRPWQESLALAIDRIYS
jgi:dTDP-4-dehydrorhamnose reductase